MRRKTVLLIPLLMVGFAVAESAAAERLFDFGRYAENQVPPGFRSTVTGAGGPGDWRVIFDETESAMPAFEGQPRAVTKRAVLAQLSEDKADEHFPLFIWEADTFTDFKLTTRFKTLRGAVEQMAGIAFRVQNESNYYVLRASSLGNTFRFYKVVDGQRGPPYGMDTPVPSGVWHELGIDCEGNQIRCFLNGKQIIPTLTDNSFNSGKIAFWTKSDSVSCFADTRISYKPVQAPGQVLVRRILERYPRLLGLEIYMTGQQPDTTRLVAAKDESARGRAGGKEELDTLRNASIYYGKAKGAVTVTMPLRDRNGELLAAVKVRMKSFPGQTEQNAVIRATPIVKALQAEVSSAQDLE